MPARGPGTHSHNENLFQGKVHRLGCVSLRVQGTEPRQTEVGSKGSTATRARPSPTRLLPPRDSGTVGAGAHWALSPTMALGVPQLSPVTWGPRKASYRAGLPTGTDIHQQREGPEGPRAQNPVTVHPVSCRRVGAPPTLRRRGKGKKGKQLLGLSASVHPAPRQAASVWMSVSDFPGQEHSRISVTSKGQSGSQPRRSGPIARSHVVTSTRCARLRPQAASL